jgi:hypothetical protein
VRKPETTMVTMDSRIQGAAPWAGAMAADCAQYALGTCKPRLKWTRMLTKIAPAKLTAARKDGHAPSAPPGGFVPGGMMTVTERLRSPENFPLSRSATAASCCLRAVRHSRISTRHPIRIKPGSGVGRHRPLGPERNLVSLRHLCQFGFG